MTTESARRLALAMIEQARADWRRGIDRPPWSPWGRRSAEAGDWLFNPDRKAHLSFHLCCEVLGIDPSQKRIALRAKYEVPQTENQAIDRG
jgi:hypothetical protein